MVDPNVTPQSKPDPLGDRRGVLVTALVVVALLAGIAGGFAWRHYGMADGGGFSLPSPAQIDARIDTISKQLAVEVGASADQQAKIAAIAKTAAADLRPLVEKEMAARNQAVALLTAPTIDVAAIQRLIADQVTLTEAVTKRIGQMLTEAAGVLTPEQRKKLGEWILREGPWHRWHHA
jgi:periplasmic protein CpxP/Spy